MNWCNLLIHETLNKVPENEAHKDIRKTISAYLSELGPKGIAVIPTVSTVSKVLKLTGGPEVTLQQEIKPIQAKE